MVVLTALLLVFVVGLAVVVVFQTAALIELFRDLRQVREQARLLDASTPIALTVEGTLKSASEHGLPEQLELSESGAVLILNDKCATCSALFSEISAHPPPGLFIYLAVPTPELGHAWVESHRATESDLEIGLDVGDAISGSLGIHVSPALVLFERGLPVSAHTVPSGRALKELLSSAAARASAGYTLSDE